MNCSFAPYSPVEVIDYKSDQPNRCFSVIDDYYIIDTMGSARVSKMDPSACEKGNRYDYDSTSSMNTSIAESPAI